MAGPEIVRNQKGISRLQFLAALGAVAASGPALALLNFLHETNQTSQTRVSEIGATATAGTGNSEIGNTQDWDNGVVRNTEAATLLLLTSFHDGNQVIDSVSSASLVLPPVPILEALGYDPATRYVLAARHAFTITGDPDSPISFDNLVLSRTIQRKSVSLSNAHNSHLRIFGAHSRDGKILDAVILAIPGQDAAIFDDLVSYGLGMADTQPRRGDKLLIMGYPQEVQPGVFPPMYRTVASVLDPHTADGVELNMLGDFGISGGPAVNRRGEVALIMHELNSTDSNILWGESIVDAVWPEASLPSN